MLVGWGAAAMVVWAEGVGVWGRGGVGYWCQWWCCGRLGARPTSSYELKSAAVPRVKCGGPPYDARGLLKRPLKLLTRVPLPTAIKTAEHR